MKVAFEKNVFFSNELARAMVMVNNSASKLRATEIEFQVSQHLKISNWGHTFDVLENQDRSGIDAGSPNAVTKEMVLDLGRIKYAVSPNKKKKTGLLSSTVVERSPEEIFLLSQLAPACHSKYITNTYTLNVNVKYEGCTCCSSLPSISIPLTIIPLTHQESYGFTEPPGYAPYELGYFKFDLIAYQF
jgi:hypothetical protein